MYENSDEVEREIAETEERGLLYVAMTRVRNQVSILSHNLFSVCACCR